jgi:hypothetical protein
MSSERVEDTQVKGSDGSAHVHDISKEKQQAGLARERSTPRRLWIDAICINQSDFDERNQQIRLMSKIYSNSKNIDVWLGDQSEGSDQAMDFLSRLGRETLRGETNAGAWILKEMTTPSFSRRTDRIIIDASLIHPRLDLVGIYTRGNGRRSLYVRPTDDFQQSSFCYT